MSEAKENRRRGDVEKKVEKKKAHHQDAKAPRTGLRRKGGATVHLRAPLGAHSFLLVPVCPGVLVMNLLPSLLHASTSPVPFASIEQG